MTIIDAEDSHRRYSVKKILVEELGVDPDTVKPETKIKDELGADSLDVMQLLMTIEDEYGVTIPDEELTSFETVQDVCDFLEKQNP